MLASPQVALWGFLLPVVYVLASSLTNLVFKDALILKARRAPPAAAGASDGAGRGHGKGSCGCCAAAWLGSETDRPAVSFAQAPCPNCGTESTVYFGDILTIPGGGLCCCCCRCCCM